MLVSLFVTWIYFRLWVFPTCLIPECFKAYLASESDAAPIIWQACYLVILCCVLVCMHVYWLLYLVKTALAYVNKSDLINQFDNQKGK